MKYNLEKKNGKWIYDDNFLEWLKNNSKNYSGILPISKKINIPYDTLRRLIKKKNIKLEITEKDLNEIISNWEGE